jgi:arsenate reductase
MNITIYHNPRCSKSRKTLEILQSEGISPTVVEYLVTPPDADTLLRLAKLLDVALADLLRRGEDDFKDAGDSVPLGDEVALADWLHNNPRVLERPIVVDEEMDRAVMGRPPENVQDLLNRD